ncbi:hypothetical protein chiPu_0024597, partial [Chiloscyllium punctatum]|nr:hypothetical protein [Chiloscyllium punctatum]
RETSLLGWCLTSSMLSRGELSQTAVKSNGKVNGLTFCRKAAFAPTPPPTCCRKVDFGQLQGSNGNVRRFAGAGAGAGAGGGGCNGEKVGLRMEPGRSRPPPQPEARKWSPSCGLGRTLQLGPGSRGRSWGPGPGVGAGARGRSWGPGPELGPGVGAGARGRSWGPGSELGPGVGAGAWGPSNSLLLIFRP